MIKVRLLIVKLVCWLCLPKEIWVANHFGAYTQKWSIHFARLDNRGVLQGVSEESIGLLKRTAKKNG